jgi:hypothetical protein
MATPPQPFPPFEIPPDARLGQVVHSEDGWEYVVVSLDPSTCEARLVAGTDLGNEERYRDRIAQAIDLLEKADANWDTLTNAQKDAALHLTVRVVAKLARLAVRNLGADGTADTMIVQLSSLLSASLSGAVGASVEGAQPE